ncbi:MAG: hypothetical protein MI867_05335 [Pseudomonadales bacterium]|nr:hypothetical protein [Pseudomonadales bacterium]
MWPYEIAPKQVPLEDAKNGTIIIITAGGYRHQRFALRLMEAFGDRVVAWYQVTYPSLSHKDKLGKVKRLIERKAAGSGAGFFNTFLRYQKLFGLRRVIRNGLAPIFSAYANFRHHRRIDEGDREVFGFEMDHLLPKGHLTPEKVGFDEVNSEPFIEKLKAHNAYFLCTLGGPLYKKGVLESVKGATINQHAGHSPDYKGSSTTEWALFQRNYDQVSSTVHISLTGADSGPIIRRSNPAMARTDSSYKIFSRVVALGTEMMIEAVEEIIEKGSITVFDQAPDAGRTYTSLDFDHQLYFGVQKDFSSGLYQDLLAKRKEF